MKGTASEATFVALLAARSRAVSGSKKGDKTRDWNILPKLVAYCSDQVGIRRCSDVIDMVVITRFHLGGILNANTDGVKCGNTKILIQKVICRPSISTGV